jgi:hypothetical protein
MSGTAIALDGSNTVFSDDIVNGEVKAADIGTGAVLSDEIATDAVNTAEVANNSLRSNDVRNGTLNSDDVSDESLTGGDLLNQSVTANDIDWSTLNLATAVSYDSGCDDDDGAGSTCVSATVHLDNIGWITINATGTWDTYAFNDTLGANQGSDDTNVVQGSCKLRFDGTPLGYPQVVGEANASGTGIPVHPSGLEGTLALTARTPSVPGGDHTVELFCTETDGDIDFNNLNLTAQGSIG